MASYTTTTENLGSLSRGLLPHPKYVGQTAGKLMFTLTLSATTTGVAAGNLTAAAAAASTQFALTNPSTSGKNLVLTKFQVGIISGTASAGPLFHGYMTTNPTIASIGGTIRNNLLGNSTASVATPHSLAAGSALTGGSAPITFRQADFSSTNTVQATVGLIKTTEILDGDIIIPPGITWVPLWSSAGTSLLNAYSVTWYEMGL